MEFEQLIVETDGPVATLRLNNPAKMNALSLQLTASLIAALESIRDDAGVRAVVVTGEGKAFSSGADLSVVGDSYERGEAPDVSVFLDGYNRLIPLVAEMPKPVLAALNGATVGAGLSLALACDLRVAAEDATFGMAFVHIGLVPDSGAAYFLPRAVGAARALELSLTGERIDAARALEIGLISRTVPAGKCLEETQRLARELADLPTAAIALTKRLFRDTTATSLGGTLAIEAEIQTEAANTQDHMEGVRAFLEKRRPEFRGR